MHQPSLVVATPNQRKPNLASIKEELGEIKIAIDLFRESLAGQQELIGNTHPNTLRTMMNLARALDANKKHDEAVSLMEEQFRLAVDHLEWKHRLTTEAAIQLAKCYRSLSLIEEEESLLLNAFAALKGQPTGVPENELEIRVESLIDRIVDLYEIMGRTKKAQAWKAKLNDQR